MGADAADLAALAAEVKRRARAAGLDAVGIGPATRFDAAGSTKRFAHRSRRWKVSAT